MRYLWLLMASSAWSLAPLSAALAHGAQTGEQDSGHGLFWIYGFLLAGIAGLIIYRKWWRGKEPPERRALKRRLGELQRAHASCLKQLQNAEDYPKECGLTGEQRRDRVESVALIRRRIDETKADLAVPSSR